MREGKLVKNYAGRDSVFTGIFTGGFNFNFGGIIYRDIFKADFTHLLLNLLNIFKGWVVQYNKTFIQPFVFTDPNQGSSQNVIALLLNSNLQFTKEENMIPVKRKDIIFCLPLLWIFILMIGKWKSNHQYYTQHFGKNINRTKIFKNKNAKTRRKQNSIFFVSKLSLYFIFFALKTGVGDHSKI